MKTLNKIASIILILTLTTASAQDANIKNIKIHFNGEFNLLSFYMNVGGIDSLNFLFDTGFDVNVLDQSIAENLGFDLSNTITEQQPGGEMTYAKIENVKLAYGEQVLYSENFISAPISQLGMLIGQPIHGIIGMEFMKKYVIELDYENATLMLSSLLSDFNLNDFEKIEVNCDDGQPFMMGSVANPDATIFPAKLKMDTGSLDAVGFNKNYLDEAHLINDNTQVNSSSGVGVGGETFGIQFRLNEIKMGSYYFNDIVVGATLEAGGTEIREDAGTIGAELLMRFNWVLDFDNNTAYLKPNKFFGQEQALDRSGIWLIEGENGEKIIYKIVKNSPGEQAGLKEGMWIESIDGINATSISLFELTQILKQEDGTKVSFEVKDAESPVIIELKSLI